MPRTSEPRNFNVISVRRRGFSATRTPDTAVVRFEGRAVSVDQSISQTVSVSTEWPDHSPGYQSLVPSVGGYGMNTPAGAGRGTGTTVVFIGSLNSGNSGTAINASMSAALNWPTPTFIGTPEYAARYSAAPAVVLPLVGGIATIQASIPNQTGTPPRPGLKTYYGQSAPNPGLILRGCNWALNGGSGHAVWHMKSWMGDDVAGLPADNRDCLSSGYGTGVTQQIVLINCEFQWSVDEVVDFYRNHNQVTFLNCAFIEPLHDSTVEHAGDPTNTDHGFGPIIGGDSQSGQPSAISTFRCLWAHTTGRNPFTNATTFVHANNLHYNHGRPAGVNADGNAVQIVSQAATDPMFANILCNGFIRGPNNRGNLVAVSVTTTLPPGSQGYSYGNAQFGWTSPSTQNGFFTSSPTGYAVGGLIDSAIPSSWGVGLSGVLQWAANPLSPTLSEWQAFVDKMERTVGASPRWRTPTNSRLRLVFQQIRDRLNGVAQTDQFVDTVAQAGGWPTISPITLNPLAANATHWHAPLPTGTDRDTVYTSGTFSDGKSRVGYTRLEAWAYEQHLFVMVVDKTAPSTPVIAVSNVSSSSQAVSLTTASTDAVSGLANYELQRATNSSFTLNVVTTTVATTGFPVSVTGLSASTTYYYRARPIDVAGNTGSYSSTVSATTSSGSATGVFFNPNIDAATTINQVFPNGPNGHDGGFATLITDPNARPGTTKSIEITYPNEEAGVQLQPLPFPATPSLFARKYVRFGPGWEGDWPLGLKTSRYFTRPDYGTDVEPNAWAYCSEKFIDGQEGMSDASQQYGRGLMCAVYNQDLYNVYDPSWLFGNGLPYIHQMWWYKWETWLVLNSAVNATDGILRLWVDDVMVMNRTNVAWRSSTRGVPNGTGWQSMWFGGNYSGSTFGAPQTTLRRYESGHYLSTTLDR